MSRTRRAALGATVSGLQLAVQLLLQTLLYPLLLHAAGAPTMGAWSMLQQVLGYFALSDLGFSIALSRWLAQAASEGVTSPAFQRLLRAGRTLQLGSGALYSLLCLSLIPLLGISRLQLPDSARTDAAHSLMILAVWSVIRTPPALSIIALQAAQRMASASALFLACSVLRLSLSIAFTLHGMGIVGLVIATIAGESLTIVGAMVLLRRLGTVPGPWMERPSPALIRELASFGLRAFAAGIAAKAIYSTDTVIVGALYGAVAAGTYYATQIPGLFCITAIWSLQDNALPGLNDLLARGDTARLRATFLQLLQLTFALALPLGAGIALFNEQVISFWVGPAQYAGPLLTRSLAVFAVVAVVVRVHLQMLYVFGDIRTFTLLLFFEATLNVALSLWLGHLLGPGGVMLASLIATLPTASWCMHEIWRRRFQLAPRELWPVARPGIIGAGAAALGGVLGRIVDPLHPWLGIAGFLLLGAPVFALSSAAILRERLPFLARVLPRPSA